MSLFGSLTTALYLIISFGLLLISGYGLTHLCLPNEDKMLRRIIMPIVGLATWVLLIENLGFLGIGTMRSAPIALLAMIAFAIVVRSRTAHAEVKSGKSAFRAWIVAGICLMLVTWPMLFLSHKEYIGFANPDAWIYFSMADFFQHYGYWDFPFSSMDISYHPILALVKGFQIIHHRVGEDYWLSSFASLIKSNTKDMYHIVHATAYMLICLSVYAMCRLGLQLDGKQALLATLFMGMNAVLALIYFQQLLTHLMGLAILPLILGIGGLLIRIPRAGPATLLGVLLAGLFIIYPELLPFALIPVGTYLIFSWRELSHRTLFKLVCIIIVTMIVVSPVYSIHGLDFLRSQMAARPGGRTYFYAFRPIMFPIYWGLTGAHIAYTTLLSQQIVLTKLALVFPLAFGLLGVSVFGIYRLAQRRNRAFLTYLIAFSLIGTGLLLAKGNYTYGFFKFLSYTQFLVLTALAVGLIDLWRSRETDSVKRFRKPLAATLGGAYLGLNLLSVLSFGFISSQEKASFGLRNAVHLPNGNAYHGLRAHVRSVVPPDESVMINVASLIPQLYLSYYLKDVPISIAQPSSYLANLYREPVPLHHSFKDSYLVEAHGASRDIVDNRTSEPLWENQSFALFSFPTPFVSLVIPDATADIDTNWYTLEYDGKTGHPFRWVNNDAMIRVIGRAGSSLSLAVELEPAPWDLSPHRTIDLFVNDVLLQTVQVTGRTRVLSIPFNLPSDDTLIRLHFSGDAGPLRIKNRLFRFLLGDIRDLRKLNVRVFNIGVRPVSSQSEALPSKIEFSPSFYVTNWQGKNSVEGVEPDLWVLSSFKVRLWRDKKSNLLILSGLFPKAMTLRTTLNGREVSVVRVQKPGEQEVQIRFPDGASQPGLHDITIHSDTVIVPKDQGINSDQRRLSFRINNIYLQ